jgi:hypothetical protein
MTRGAPAASAARGLHSLLDAALERDDEQFTPAPPRRASVHIPAAAVRVDVEFPAVAPLHVPVAVSKGLDNALHAVTAALRSRSIADGILSGRPDTHRTATQLHAAVGAAEDRAFAALRRCEHARSDTQRIRLLHEQERDSDARAAAAAAASAAASSAYSDFVFVEQLRQRRTQQQEQKQLAALATQPSPLQHRPVMQAHHAPDERIVSASGHKDAVVAMSAIESTSPASMPRHQRPVRPARPPVHVGALQRRARAAAWDSD